MPELSTMTPEQIAAMAPADFAAYSAEELATMTTAQVAVLTGDQMAALAPEQLAAIAPAMEAYQTLVTSFQSATMLAAAEARAEFLAPLNDVLGSPEFAVVRERVEALGRKYDAEHRIGTLVRCLRSGLAMTAVS